MTSHRTGFVPSVHGFKFSNEFQNHVIDSGSFHFTTQGRCGGMAMVALDYFNAHVPIPAIAFVDQGLPIISGPAVCRWPDGTIHAFALRSDGSTATKQTRSTTTWSDWECLSRLPALAEGSAEIAVCAWGQGRIDVFTPGIDRCIYHLWCENGVWSGDSRPCNWLGYGERLNGTDKLSSLGVASSGANQLDLFATRDGHLYWSSFPDHWNDWRDVGAPPSVTLVAAPAVASAGDSTNVVVCASDRTLWHAQRSASGFTWLALGGVAASAPALASPTAGRLEAYVIGTDGQLHFDLVEGGRWSGWTSLGAPPVKLGTHRPSALSGPGMMDVYAIGGDGLLWHKSWSNGRWAEWVVADEKPSAAANKLTAAISDRLYKSTIDPIIRAGAATVAAGPFGGLIGYAGLGSDQNNISWPLLTDADCFTRSWTEQLKRITDWLSARKPIPIGLIPKSGLIGHQVLAIGLDTDVPLQTGPLLGACLYVYDNEYPSCDNMTIMYDPNKQTIVQSTGSVWKGVFARDDYAPLPPPTLV